MSTSALRSAAVAIGAARLSYAALRARPPGGEHRWSRVNHRGEPVTLLAGPAAALGGIAGAMAADASAAQRLAMAVATAGAAAFGGYDDLTGSGDQRGFRGHLGALARGEVTTGTVKLAGIGATGLAAALIARTWANGAGSAPLRAADLLIDAGLIAGGANLLNLFDLRPGRAAKVTIAAGALIAAAPTGRPVAAPPVAVAAALLPEDLAERAMLGDAGANALGALLGAAAAVSLSRPHRVAALAVVAGLTAASEVISFTRVIERTPPLRWLDLLGRRQPQPPAGPPAPPDREPAGAR